MSKRLRLRTPGGTETIDDLSGYPPSVVLVSDDDGANVWKLGIANGDQLIVKDSGAKPTDNRGTSRDAYVPPLSDDEVRRGTVVRRTVPGDNSCLFHAAAYVLESRSRSLGPSMRGKIADVVRAHPQLFTTDYLGTSNEEYCRRIVQSDFWGGAIELSILSFLYGIEIRSFDAQTGRVDRYGTSEKYSRMALLLYTNGNHYDCLAFSPYGGAPEGSDRVVFSIRDEGVMAKARALVEVEFKKQFGR